MLAMTSNETTPGELQREIALRPDGFALYFDFDGTMVDIAERPEDVVVPAGLLDDIIGLKRLLGGALGIITGRRLAEISAFLAPAGLDMSGLHGLEFSFQLAADRAPPAAEAPKALADAIVQMVAGDQGLRLENKGPILAVHYRQSPAAHGRVRTGIALSLIHI